jgi:hypothetical protein
VINRGDFDGGFNPETPPQPQWGDVGYDMSDVDHRPKRGPIYEFGKRVFFILAAFFFTILFCLLLMFWFGVAFARAPFK